MNHTVLEIGIIFTVSGLLVIAGSFGSKDDTKSVPVGNGSMTTNSSSEPISCDAKGNYTSPMKGTGLFPRGESEHRGVWVGNGKYNVAYGWTSGELLRSQQITMSVEDYEKAVGGDWKIEEFFPNNTIFWRNKVTGARYYTGDLFPPKL